MELRNMCKSGIYKIVNTCNGKIYVGSSRNVYKRKAEHFNQLYNDKHPNKHLQSAFNKYSKICFIFEIIECVKDINNLLEREQFWIDKLSACNRKFGYNTQLIAGSNLGLKRSKETRNKIRMSQIGRKMPEKTKLAISKRHSKGVMNITTGEIFKNIREAGKIYNVSVSGISRACHGKQQHARNCEWKFL